ncbi:MAG: DMT family transporter [Phyllobacteriaceae bacterium]|nr:DMT family transporter [Phyllobacteriaceae bacterium]
MDSLIPPKPLNHPVRADRARGIALVTLSALAWSFGGAIQRFLTIADPWATVFWRSGFASAFLIAFMLWRDGPAETRRSFLGMGWPGLAVAICFTIASTFFVVALSFTTVANVMLMNAGVPLIAALLAWLVFRDRVDGPTWAAIAAVFGGVAIMVSGSFGGGISLIGDVLALGIAVAFATATVITRHFAHVRMTAATALGTGIGSAIAFLFAGPVAVGAADFGLLFAFGALNLGLGLALFVTGARLVPAALAALLGTLETVLGPVWVWLIHGEAPSFRTLAGGALIFVALLAHIALQARRDRPGL